MITNLVASIIVTLVTNTTETVSKHWVTDPCPGGVTQFGAVTWSCAVIHGHFENDTSPTSKTVTTEIVERKTVTFTLGGESWSVVKDRSVTNWSEAYSLKTESKWVPVQPPGNPLNALGAILFTNKVIWTRDGESEPSRSTFAR